MKTNTIICGDCLEVMRGMPDNSVDLVLTDPPYGITACEWDSIIPLEPMWEQLKRVIKPNGAIVMTASQPFTTTLIASNMKMFKYCWVWEKPKGTGHLNAKKRPMNNYEDIAVFYKSQCTYNPQWTNGEPYTSNKSGSIDKVAKTEVSGKHFDGPNSSNGSDGRRYPKRVQRFGVVERETVHPTQKPVDLMEYLIKTYTNEGETVLDFTMGSGTTCVAAKRLGRNYIGIDISPEYCDIARKRLEAEEKGLTVKEVSKGQMSLLEKDVL